jgi:hypothetical protein
MDRDRKDKKRRWMRMRMKHGLTTPELLSILDDVYDPEDVHDESVSLDPKASALLYVGTAPREAGEELQ